MVALWASVVCCATSTLPLPESSLLKMLFSPMVIVPGGIDVGVKVAVGVLVGALVGVLVGVLAGVLVGVGEATTPVFNVA
jgi:hypothetical protein